MNEYPFSNFSKIQVIVGETEGRELEMEAFVLPNQVQSNPGLSKKAI